MSVAFFTDSEQQTRLQYGRASSREPTHWIITTDFAFCSSVLSS
jgi:hypothetical protein